MFCKNCGAELRAGAKFCVKCGTEARTHNVPTVPPPGNLPKPAAESRNITFPAAEMIKRRSLVKLIFLSLVTFGIYGLYWIHRLSKDVNILCDGDGKKTAGWLKYFLLNLVTCGIYGLVWSYKLANRLRDNSAKYDLYLKKGGGTVVLWSTLGSLILVGPFIAWHIIIKHTNALAEAHNKKYGLEEPKDAHAKLKLALIIIGIVVVLAVSLVVKEIVQNNLWKDAFSETWTSTESDDDFIETWEDDEPLTGEWMYITSPEGLAVRDSPGISGNKLTVLPYGQIVEIIRTDDKKVTIDGITDYWKYINSDEVSGWVFGGYLTPDSPED